MSAGAPAGSAALPIGLLAAAAFIAMASMRGTDTLLPAIAHDFSTDVATAAAIVTAYALAYGVAQLAYGPLGDRVGKLRVIAATVAAAGLASLASAAATGVPSLAALRFAAGFAFAACIPLSLALIGDAVEYAARQATIGRLLAAINMGQVLGGSLAGVIAEAVGWRAVFVAIGAIALVVAWPLHRAASAWPAPAPAPRGTARGGLAAYLALLQRRSARLLVTAVLIEGFFFYGALPYGGALLHARFGLNYLEIGLVLAAFGVGGLGYSAAVKWLVRTLGERGMVLAGALAVAAAYVAIAFAPHWTVVAAALAVGGFFFYMLHSTFQTLATELAPESRGVAVSLFVFMVLAGTAVGVAALGRVVAHGGYTELFLVAAAGVACLGLWFQRHLQEFKERA